MTLRSRELADRGSNGTQVRLLWRQGTRQLWVEVWEPGTAWALRIQVQPEKALDVFHHPYAYAGLQHSLPPAESLAFVSAHHKPSTRSAMGSEALRSRVAQLEQIALATDDVEGLRDFYRLLGGVASPLCIDPESGLRSCVLDFCGVRLELLERPDRGEGAAVDGQSSGLVYLGFALGSADAVDELSGVIAAAGHRVLEPPHRTGELGRYESVVLDPDGNRLKLTV